MLDMWLPVQVLRGLLQYADVDCLWGDPELCEELSPALSSGVRDGAGKLLFFTSGTTERSKAVVLTDHSLCQSAWNGGEKLPLRPEDRLLCILPLGHVFGFVCGLLWGLSCGASVALGRGSRHYADDCAYYHPTALSAVPLLLGFLIKQRLFNPELKLVLVGAGDCPKPLLDAAAAMGVRVSFGYGLTETSSGVAISVSGDPFAMEICPDDTITLAEDGEILIQAPTCMMQGYYKRPADTAAVLVDGVLYSGDLGRFDEDGKLHITGRKKDMLVLPDGTKLFLPEYEGELTRALGHAELAVILLDRKPVLVYSGEAEEKDLAEKLRPLMADKPRGQQLARILITDTPLPRTATGKIKRWELQQKMESAL
jgi:long-subunit acyl-CoA synthetase (AMP-forming)